MVVPGLVASNDEDRTRRKAEKKINLILDSILNCFCKTSAETFWYFLQFFVLTNQLLHPPEEKVKEKYRLQLVISDYLLKFIHKILSCSFCLLFAKSWWDSNLVHGKHLYWAAKSIILFATIQMPGLSFMFKNKLLWLSIDVEVQIYKLTLQPNQNKKNDIRTQRVLIVSFELLLLVVSKCHFIAAFRLFLRPMKTLLYKNYWFISTFCMSRRLTPLKYLLII